MVDHASPTLRGDPRLQRIRRGARRSRVRKRRRSRHTPADDGRLEAVAPPPFVDLDPEHFGNLADFERRFPDGPPSLAGCERFVVRGNASFAA